MTQLADIANRALQMLGTRTTVSAAELADSASVPRGPTASNEAIQFNLISASTLTELLRMAPWDCAVTTDILALICARPGTPENPGQDPGYWAKGMPLPPWLYEYTYPSDCLRALRIEPFRSPYFAPGSTDASFDDSTDNGDGAAVVPTTYTDGFLQGGFDPGFQQAYAIPGSPSVLPIYPGGAGYLNPNPGPIRFKVALDKNQLTKLSKDAQGNYIPAAPFDQRVVLTNQSGAVLRYIKSITDPALMDPLFLQAWIAVIASRLALALTGDKALSNMAVQMTNRAISEARASDGNEGFDVDDRTPDWIATRGYPLGPNRDFDYVNWGALWPTV